MTHIIWSARKNSAMPIVDVQGETDGKDAIQYMLIRASEVIDRAENFEGIPLATAENRPTTYEWGVYFPILFKTEEELQAWTEEAMEHLS